MKKRNKIFLSTVGIISLASSVALPLTSCNIFGELKTGVENTDKDDFENLNPPSNNDIDNDDFVNLNPPSNNDIDNDDFVNLNPPSNNDGSDGGELIPPSNNDGSNGDELIPPSNENDTELLTENDRQALDLFEQNLSWWTDEKLNKFNEFISNEVKINEIFIKFSREKIIGESKYKLIDEYIKEQLKNTSSKIYSEFLFKNQSDLNGIKHILKNYVDNISSINSEFIFNKFVNQSNSDKNIDSFIKFNYKSNVSNSDNSSWYTYSEMLLKVNPNIIDNNIDVKLEFEKIVKNNKHIGFKINSIKSSTSIEYVTRKKNSNNGYTTKDVSKANYEVNFLHSGFNVDQIFLKFLISEFSKTIK